jgi:hypothetical protein
MIAAYLLGCKLAKLYVYLFSTTMTTDTSQLQTHKPFDNLIWVQEADYKEVQDLLPNTKWRFEIIPTLNEL